MCDWKERRIQTRYYKRMNDRHFNYQRFIHSNGTQNFDFNHIDATPSLCFGKHRSHNWVNSDNDLLKSRKEINFLPETFKKGGDNEKGWVKLKYDSNLGRHHNGARRGNSKRNKTTKGKNKTGRGYISKISYN